MGSHIYRHQNAKEEVFGQSLQMHALKEVLKHHHWRTISFLKMVLESHHDKPRILSLIMGDKKVYFTICFTFVKAIVIFGDAKLP